MSTDNITCIAVQQSHRVVPPVCYNDGWWWYSVITTGHIRGPGEQLSLTEGGEVPTVVTSLSLYVVIPATPKVSSTVRLTDIYLSGTSRIINLDSPLTLTTASLSPVTAISNGLSGRDRELIIFMSRDNILIFLSQSTSSRLPYSITARPLIPQSSITSRIFMSYFMHFWALIASTGFLLRDGWYPAAEICLSLEGETGNINRYGNVMVGILKRNRPHCKRLENKLFIVLSGSKFNIFFF